MHSSAGLPGSTVLHSTVAVLRSFGVRDLIGNLSAMIGRFGMVLLATVCALAIVGCALSISRLAFSIDVDKVDRRERQEASLLAMVQAHSNLGRDLYALMNGTARLIPSDLPLAQAWARSQTTYNGLCGSGSQGSPTTEEMSAICGDLGNTYSRWGPILAGGDPQREAIDRETFDEHMAVGSRLNRALAKASAEAKALTSRMSLEYRDTVLALVVSSGALIAAGFALIVLVGRASSRYAEQLRETDESNFRLRETIEALPAGIVLYDSDDRLVAFNAAAAAINPRLADSIGKSYTELATGMARKLHVGEFGSAEEFVARLRQEGDRRLLRTLDGRCYERSRVAMPSGGAVGLWVDVSDLKRREEELDRSRAEYQALVESLSDAVYAVDENGRIQFASASLLAMLGEPLSKVMGSAFLHYVVREDRGWVVPAVRKFHEASDHSVGQAQFRMVRSNGEAFPVEVRYRKPEASGPAKIAQVGVIRDISDRVRLTEHLALQAKEAERARHDFQTLVDSLSDLVCRIDSQGCFQFANAAATKLLGTTPEHLVGRPFLDFVAAEDVDAVRSLGQRIDASSSEEVHDLQIRMKTFDGGTRWFDLRTRAMIDVDGKNSFRVGILRDVDRTLALQRHLDEEREHLKSIVESSGALILVVDRGLKAIMANREFSKVTGLDATDLIGRPLKDVVNCPLDPAIIARWQNGPLSPADTKPVRFTNAIVSAGGDTRLLSVTAKPIVDGNRIMQQIVFLGVDDTERRAAEQTLYDSERLVTAGEMAGAAAHEIAQPLQVINLASSSAREELMQAEAEARQPDIGFLVKRLERIDGQIERAGHIVGDLRAFVRGVSTDIAAPFDAGAAVRSAIDLTRHGLDMARVKLSDAIENGLPPVNGHFSRLEQVLINLINNARDAGAKSVVVSVRRVEQPDGAKVRIAVEDTGPGIPLDVLPRLFNTFVTTKLRGQGTGLGLRICKRIVEEMDGTIGAGNRREGGARFEILLPVAA